MKQVSVFSLKTVQNLKMINLLEIVHQNGFKRPRTNAGYVEQIQDKLTQTQYTNC